MQTVAANREIAGHLIPPLSSGSHSRTGGEMCIMAAKLAKYSVAAPGGCILWTGYIQPNGYGYMSVKGKSYPAHRAALILSGVDVPFGMDVCHHCDVRNCVNPEHLYAGTRRQNMADCSLRNRHNKPSGEKHWRAKLTAEQVRLIRIRRNNGETVKSLAIEFRVHHGSISRIARNIWRSEVSA